MGKKLPPVLLDQTLDPIATDGNHHAVFGSGVPDFPWNASDGVFEFNKHHDTREILLYSAIAYRQGDFAEPDSVTTGKHTVLHYTMPDGTQVIDPEHNVPSNNANRSATSFNFEFATVDQTIEQFLNSGGEFHFKIDLDAGAKEKLLDLHAVYDPTINTGGSHIIWEDKNGNIFIADDGGNDHVTGNSQNFAFYQSLIDTNPQLKGVQTGPIGAAGEYDIYEQVFFNNRLVAEHHSDVLLA